MNTVNSPYIMMSMQPEDITLGVSACLLGEEVRHDGRHKRQTLVAETFPRYFSMVPLCPEVMAGMGVPRPPIRLLQSGGVIQACQTDDSRVRVTGPLRDCAWQVVQDHGMLGGYIFKSRSPSCGVSDTPLHDENGRQVDAGPGLYTAELRRRLPLLPVIDERRLEQPAHFECFIRRVGVYHAWQALQRDGITAARLGDFAAAHRGLVRAHDPGASEDLSGLAASVSGATSDEIGARYIRGALEAIGKPATVQQHTDVMLDMFVSVKARMEAEARNDLSAAIAGYHCSEVSWHVPVGLLRAAFGKTPPPDYCTQAYLYPHPSLDLLQNNTLMLYGAGN